MRCELCESYTGHGFCFLVECCGEEEHLALRQMGSASYVCPKCGKAVTVTIASTIELH
jgi:hypothetical protein